MINAWVQRRKLVCCGSLVTRYQIWVREDDGHITILDEEFTHRGSAEDFLRGYLYGGSKHGF